MNEFFKQDWKRYKRSEWSRKYLIDLLKSQTMKYILAGRLSTSQNKYLCKIMWGGQKHLGNKMGCEIGWENVGPGLVLAHPYGITVNGGVKIGKDCTLFKGSTIGSVRGGKNAGVPCLGDRVVVCCNAMVCGNIIIGNDVLIAAGAYVNFDVPDNSVVIGNPGKIHRKENPAKYYV